KARLHRNKGLEKVLFWLVTGCAGVSLAHIILPLRHGEGMRGAYEHQFRMVNSDIALTLYVAMYAVTGVVFLVWKYRATDNLIKVRGPQSVTPAGAVYWYFVPIAWFWKPFEA